MDNKGFIISDRNPGERYNRESVDNAIRANNRYRRDKIGKREALLIHALLKGRDNG